MSLLKIEDLHARVDGKEILKGVDLEIAAGEVHAIMGLAGLSSTALNGSRRRRATGHGWPGWTMCQGRLGELHA